MERRRKNDGLFHLYYHIKTTHRDYTITTLRPQDDSPLQATDQITDHRRYNPTIISLHHSVSHHQVILRHESRCRLYVEGVSGV